MDRRPFPENHVSRALNDLTRNLGPVRRTAPIEWGEPDVQQSNRESGRRYVTPHWPTYLKHIATSRGSSFKVIVQKRIEKENARASKAIPKLSSKNTQKRIVETP